MLKWFIHCRHGLLADFLFLVQRSIESIAITKHKYQMHTAGTEMGKRTTLNISCKNVFTNWTINCFDRGVFHGSRDGKVHSVRLAAVCRVARAACDYVLDF